jgi:c-di-AMP phosphodiesterase-like protein
MLKSVEGVYRDGKIELTEFPEDVRNDTRVIVTFLEMDHIDLQARGIDEAQAAELRAQLGTFAEEWNSPDMALYDNYDAGKAKLETW